MKQIIWNAIITTIITLTGVFLNWYLLRYKIEPIPIPSSQHIKETIKRTGKRLIKGVLNGIVLLVTFVGPLFGLYSEYSSDAPISRYSLIIVAYYAFIFTTAVCLTIGVFFSLYISRHTSKMIREMIVESAIRQIDFTGELAKNHSEVITSIISTLRVMAEKGNLLETELTQEGDAKDEQDTSKPDQ